VRVALESENGLKAGPIRREIRRLTREARKYLRGASTLSKRLKQFNRFFFIDAGFGPAVEGDSAESLLIHKVLQNRRGNCVGLAQAYLVIAQRLHLPVVAAATPTHLLVRWVDGAERVNVELLERGLGRSDAEYRQEHAIREADPSQPVFLRDLSSEEVAARIFNNRGVLRSRAGVPEEAAGDYQRAVELDPRFPAPHYNLALDLLNAGRAAEALAHLDAALALHPSDPWALNNRALVRWRLGQATEAVMDLERALAIQSEFPTARRNLELVRAAMNRSPVLSDAPPAAAPGIDRGSELTGPRP
jgi:regulator of sirC expression with transglutaminase-like and TPR domain